MLIVVLCLVSDLSRIGSRTTNDTSLEAHWGAPRGSSCPKPGPTVGGRPAGYGWRGIYSYVLRSPSPGHVAEACACRSAEDAPCPFRAGFVEPCGKTLQRREGPMGRCIRLMSCSGPRGWWCQNKSGAVHRRRRRRRPRRCPTTTQRSPLPSEHRHGCRLCVRGPHRRRWPSWQIWALLARWPNLFGEGRQEVASEGRDQEVSGRGARGHRRRRQMAQHCPGTLR